MTAQPVFDAIARSRSRRAILAMLAEAPAAVEAVAARFPVSRPAVSKHLKALLSAGLVRCVARGRHNI